MEQITSPNNKRIKRLVLLRDKAKERRQAQSFVIEGIRLVLDAPKAFLLDVYMTDRLYEEMQGAREDGAQNERDLARLRAKIPEDHLFVVPEEIFRKMSDTTTPQGILAEAKMPIYTRDEVLTGREGKAPLILMTENVQDPGNLGTMIRTAEAAGVTGVIMSKGTVDLFHPKTVRSTMSAIFRVPFLVTEDFTAEVEALNAQGINTYAAYLGGALNYDECDYTKPSAFLIGNEGNGLTLEAADAAGCKILIPMEGSIESLNAAMSAGILVYEASRQRRI